MNINMMALSRWLMQAAPVALLLAAGCAQQAATATVAIPPVPAGEARIWVYRDYEPYADKGLPAVGVNGGVVGVAQLGGAFYRNVSPGHYTISVESTGADVNQVAGLDVTPGQEAYVKIVSNPELGERRGHHSIRAANLLCSADTGRADIAHLSFSGGS